LSSVDSIKSTQRSNESVESVSLRESSAFFSSINISDSSILSSSSDHKSQKSKSRVESSDFSFSTFD